MIFQTISLWVLDILFGFDRLDDEGEDVGDATFKINVLQIGSEL